MDRLGPGIWVSIHISALVSKDLTSAQVTAYHIREWIKRLPGIKCRKRATQYLVTNPPEIHLDHLFEWTVHFHNSVNQRLGKEVWSISKARRHYQFPTNPQRKCQLDR